MYNELIQKYFDYLLENSQPLTPMWNIENIRLGKKPKWNYIDGCMIKAVLEMYTITGKQQYLDFADRFIDHYVREDGSILGYEVEIYDIDSINEGKVLFDLLKLTGKKKYKLALDHIYQQILTHPRTGEGNYWHKKIYPHQVWLDGLYMAQPFYIEYETLYNNKKGYRDTFDQFANVVRLMRDQKTGLYYHGYDESRSMFWCNKETGLSPNFWLRALGWFSMAMVDVLEKADPSGCGGRDKILAEDFRDLIDSLLHFQDKQSGMWYQVVDKPEVRENYLETSGSAILSYCILKAVRLGILDGSYREFGQRAFDGICKTYLKEIDGNMTLGGICLMAGLGGKDNRDGSIEYYLSEPVVENEAKGVAPFFLAYSEILRVQGIKKQIDYPV